MSYKRLPDATVLFRGVLEYAGGPVKLGPYKTVHAARVATGGFLHYNKRMGEPTDRYVEVAEITWKRVES